MGELNLSSQQRAALAAAGCEAAFDPLTRRLYATDASIHQVVPGAVAFPRNGAEAAAIVRAAVQAGVAVTPRGAGTGLVGGAIGEGLVVDFSRHLRGITELDLERRTVRAGAGVVLDQLNAFLKPHGLGFGPDVATSSRATVGGMIANNSSGAYTPVYGVVADHVEECEIVLAEGRLARAGGPVEGEASWGSDTRRRMEEWIRPHADEIARRMPEGLGKRWPGYGIDRWARKPDNLADLLAGSEGTLAAVVSARLRLVALPRRKGVGLVFFASVEEALEATVALLELGPAAVEHIDRLLLDQTRGQRAFQGARDYLQLESAPCESMLIVEFFDGRVSDGLAALKSRRLGLRTQTTEDPAEQNLVWNLRKAGLSLITGRAGEAKPATCIEDTAVPPARLPEYVRGLKGILKPRGLEACLYGHAASGLLHVRPVLNLKTAEGVRQLREATVEVSALVREFGGSFCAEHGVGIARTEFMEEHLGSSLLHLHQLIKGEFDPRGAFNPGKIIADPDRDYRLDTRLRQGAGRKLKLPFPGRLAFAAKDGSFIRNLEQCNGCGGCRKETPTMCPTFVATGAEAMSPRGRANGIRAALEGRLVPGGPVVSLLGLTELLESCLSCKACATECPSNVSLPLLKAELTHARHRTEGVPWLAQAVSRVDLLGRLGCLAPRAANALLELPLARALLQKVLGLAASRPLPRFAAERFDRWFARRSAGARGASRGPVLLWDDTFTRYHETHIGRAAVTVLEAAGYEVRLIKGRRCCGRPAMSQGRLDEAERLGRHNLAVLAALESAPGGLAPVVFLEPSCWSMFVDDYRELKLEGAARIGARCVLFETFIADLLQREPGALVFKKGAAPVAVHAHCHAKALGGGAGIARLAAQLPGAQNRVLASGCCGMAGAFGALESKQTLSRQVADPLVRMIAGLAPGTELAASGTSCRQQIGHLTAATPRHMAEILAGLIEPSSKV